MNVIFPLILLLSIVFSLFNSPTATLTALSIGGDKAVKLSLTLIAVYAVWTGIINILSASGATEKLSKIFEKPIKRLFNTKDDETAKKLSLNVTANMLGVSGVATPAGIEAMRLLDKKDNSHGKTLLTVISSTSIQLLPLSVLQLLSSYGGDVSSVILVSFISTFFTTVIGVILVKVFK